MHLLKDLIDLILPPICYICKRRLKSEENIICNDCYSRIRLLSPPYCERCGRPLSTPDIKVCNTCIIERHPCSYIRGISPYDGIAEHLITLLKYNGKIGTAKILGKLMIQAILKEEIYRNCNVIVPVPLHTTRTRERGYNQAELLGKELSVELNIPLVFDALIRVRATPSQTKLPSEKRATNVKDAFVVNKQRIELIKDKTILLVDDVLTTGATLNECARTLLKGDVKEVLGIVSAIA
ncbi:MAG: ComF family protein [candidate division WOR-3 bacterium]|nr:ComF family protein [candidate division WOR-3 bacterium]